jgi:hypothetical protein
MMGLAVSPIARIGYAENKTDCCAPLPDRGKNPCRLGAVAVAEEELAEIDRRPRLKGPDCFIAGFHDRRRSRLTYRPC